MDFKERLRKIREDKGYTQDDLSRLSGIKKSNISKYENGIHEPTVSILCRLADALDVSIDYLTARDAKVISEKEENYNVIMSEEEIKLIITLRKIKFKDLRSYILLDPQRSLTNIMEKQKVKELINMTIIN